ncbi:hypothetical protein TKK_0000883 [Trichogramma kaykai]
MFRPGEIEHLLSDYVNFIVDKYDFFRDLAKFEELTKSVLPRGAADSNVADAERSTPLHIICKEYEDDVRLAETFLIHVNGKLIEPVRIDTQDKLGNAPLHLAILHSGRKLTELFLRRGADPNLANEEGETPLHLVCRRYRDSYKKNCGRNEDEDEDEDEDVDDGVVRSFFGIVKELGMTLRFDARDKKGRTPLRLAVSNLLPRVVDTLFDSGADLTGFVFPTWSDFGEFVASMERQKTVKLTTKRQLKVLTDTLGIIRRLELNKYVLDLHDALAVARLFAEYRLYEMSAETADLADRQPQPRPWYDEGRVAEELKKIKLMNGRTFHELVRMPLDEARKQYDYAWGFLLTRTGHVWVRRKGGAREKLEARLAAILLRGFLRIWVVEILHSLTKYRLPIDVWYDIVDKNLANEDWRAICLAGESLLEQPSDPFK